MSIGDELRDALREVMGEVLEQHRAAEVQSHTVHHEWIAQQIERDRAKAEFFRSLAAKSLAGVVWSIITAVVGYVAVNALAWLHEHWRP